MASSVIWGSNTMSSTPLCFTLWLCQWKRSLLPWGGVGQVGVSPCRGGARRGRGVVVVLLPQCPRLAHLHPSPPSDSASPQPPAGLLPRFGDTRTGGRGGVRAPRPRGRGSVLQSLHLVSHCHGGDHDARPREAECAWGSGAVGGEKGVGGGWFGRC